MTPVERSWLWIWCQLFTRHPDALGIEDPDQRKMVELLMANFLAENPTVPIVPTESVVRLVREAMEHGMQPMAAYRAVAKMAGRTPDAVRVAFERAEDKSRLQ